MTIKHFVIRRATGAIAEVYCNGETEPPMLLETGAWASTAYGRPHEVDRVVIYFLKGTNRKFVDDVARQVWNERKRHAKFVTFGLFTIHRAGVK